MNSNSVVNKTAPTVPYFLSNSFCEKKTKSIHFGQYLSVEF